MIDELERFESLRVWMPNDVAKQTFDTHITQVKEREQKLRDAAERLSRELTEARLQLKEREAEVAFLLARQGRATARRRWHGLGACEKPNPATPPSKKR